MADDLESLLASNPIASGGTQDMLEEMLSSNPSTATDTSFTKSAFAPSENLGEVVSTVGKAGLQNALNVALPGTDISRIVEGINLPDNVLKSLGYTIPGQAMEAQRREESMIAAPFQEVLQGNKERFLNAIGDAFIGQNTTEFGDVYKSVGADDRTAATLGLLTAMTVLPSSIAGARLAYKETAKVALKNRLIQDVQSDILLTPEEKIAETTAINSDFDKAAKVSELQKDLKAELRPGDISMELKPSENLGPNEKFRGLNIQAQKQEGLPEYIKGKLDGTRAYKTVSIAEVDRRVTDMVANNPIGAKDTFMNSKGWNATNARLGAKLYQTFLDLGDLNSANEVFTVLTTRATEAGQGNAMLREFSKIEPLGIKKFIQGIVNKANAEGANIIVTPAQERAILDQLALIKKLPVRSFERELQTAKLMAMCRELVPESLWKKIDTIQTMSQLLTAKTFLRNLFGNLSFGVSLGIADVFASGIDLIWSQLFRQGRTLVQPKLGYWVKGFQQGLEQGARAANLGMRLSATGIQYDIGNSRVFTKGVLSSLEKLLNYSLSVTDRAFYMAARNASLVNQMAVVKANLSKQGTIKSIIRYTPEMLEKAHLEGLYATFQNDSVLANFFGEIKKAGNKASGYMWNAFKGKKSAVNKAEFGLGSIFNKYPRTPGNLIQTGLSLTPLGYANALLQLVKPLVGVPFDRTNFLRAFSKATVGSTQIAVFYHLRKLGIVTGGDKADTKGTRALKTEAGIKNNSFNVDAFKRYVMSGFDKEQASPEAGDTYLEFSWLQPGAISWAFGSTMYDLSKAHESEQEKALGIIAAMSDVTEAGISTVMDMNILQNLRQLYTKGPLKGFLANISSIPSSFLPGILKQARYKLDPVIRDTQDSNIFKETYLKTINALPGVSKLVPEKIGAFGDTVSIDEGENITKSLTRASMNAQTLFQTGAIFDAFISPANRIKFADDEKARAALAMLDLGLEVPNQVDSKVQAFPGFEMAVRIPEEKLNLLNKQIGQQTLYVMRNLMNTPLYQNYANMDPDNPNYSITQDIVKKAATTYLTNIKTQLVSSFIMADKDLREQFTTLKRKMAKEPSPFKKAILAKEK